MIRRIKQTECNRERILETFKFATPFGVMCIGLYLPFLLGLSSQAGGILPSLIYQTRAIHYLVMFYPFIPIISLALINRFRVYRGYKKFLKILAISGILIFLLIGFNLIFPNLIEKIITISESTDQEVGVNVLGPYQAQSFGSLLAEIKNRSIDTISLKIFFIVFISLILTCIFKTAKSESNIDNKDDQNQALSFVFILLLIAIGLSILPEIIYLRDQFGWRMNTIFKFYFQIWILFSISTGYLVFYLIPRFNRTLVILVITLTIVPGLAYPFFTLKERLGNVTFSDLSFDGNQYMDSGKMEAVEFLLKSEYGNVVEAVGGSYSSYGRVSKLTGLPTVLGWPGHELQWRGGVQEIGTREVDIEELYSSGTSVIWKEVVTK